MFTANEILLNLYKSDPSTFNTSKINGQYIYWTFSEDKTEPYLFGTTYKSKKANYFT